MDITLLSLGMRYVRIKELSEKGKDHPLIQWWLSLCGFGFDAADEVPWCSAFVNGMAWELGLPRTKSASARSWLIPGIGQPVGLVDAKAGWDIVVLKRGSGPQPGPDILDAPGHVGILVQPSPLLVLGGNQGNAITIQHFDSAQVLGVKRLLTV